MWLESTSPSPSLGCVQIFPKTTVDQLKLEKVFFKINLFIRERERAHAYTCAYAHWSKDKGRGRGQEADFPLSGEPKGGVESNHPEIMT